MLLSVFFAYVNGMKPLFKALLLLVLLAVAGGAYFLYLAFFPQEAPTERASTPEQAMEIAGMQLLSPPSFLPEAVKRFKVQIIAGSDRALYYYGESQAGNMTVMSQANNGGFMVYQGISPLVFGGEPENLFSSETGRVYAFTLNGGVGDLNSIGMYWAEGRTHVTLFSETTSAAKEEWIKAADSMKALPGFVEPPPVTIAGLVGASEFGQFTLTDSSGRVYYVKNYQSPEVAGALQPLIGASAEVTGIVKPNSGDVLVLSVTGGEGKPTGSDAGSTPGEGDEVVVVNGVIGREEANLQYTVTDETGAVFYVKNYGKAGVVRALQGLVGKTAEVKGFLTPPSTDVTVTHVNGAPV
ncbi:MAG TPA: hypothetical protein VJA40_05370 [archaeon]|nr:hypothetical protein [archaeon]